MSTKRINVTTILPPSALFIGYVAENGVTNVEFDVSAWVTMYGSGTATLIMKRWGDANPYPIALEVDNEGLATWTISATDTAKTGFAYAQLRYEAGTKVKKSPIYTLKIGESLGSPAEAPDQYEDWIDALTHLAAQAMAEVLDIEGIVTDKTLTVDGGIADAKATGDALSALEDAVTEETDKLKADLGVVSTILNVEESYEELTPSDASSGGFTGEVGEQISFNTTSQWKRIGFVPESGKKYKITFYNRTGISARSYIYAVDADGVILSRYADMPSQQSEITQYEYVLSFGTTVSKVWVLGKIGSSYPLNVYNVIISTVVDDLREEIAEVDAKITPVKSPYDKGPFCTNKGDFIGYYTGKNTAYADKDTLGSSTTYAEIIALYDALMAMDTSHITKTALGTASGLDANENTYTLYEYTFAPYAYQSALLRTDATVKKLPVVLCDACIHGFEKNSTYGLYYFLYDLVNNYHNDPVLIAIRENVVLKVIPVVNPYGFDNGIYYNGNNVNINRNFYATDWSASETDHTGAEPFDQQESVIVRDWINANKDDILAYFNGHTNGTYHVTAYGDANSLMPKFGRTNEDKYFNRIANIIQRHIQAQSSRFYDMYNLSLGSNFLGKYQAETGSVGTVAVWTAEQAKIPSMTFEMCNGIKSDGETVIGLYSAESKKLCSEMIGNIIAQTVYEYSDN